MKKSFETPLEIHDRIREKCKIEPIYRARYCIKVGFAIRVTYIFDNV